MTVQELVKDTVKKAFVAIKSKIADIETALANKVSKTGDTMTGNLILKKTTTIADNNPAILRFRVVQSDNNTQTDAIIAVYDDHDAAASGTNVVMQGNGNMVIGGGESPTAFYNAYIKDQAIERNEHVFITADGGVYLLPNGNAIANIVGACLNSGRTFYPVHVNSDGNAIAGDNHVGSIGGYSNRWANAYIDNIYSSEGHIQLAYSATYAELYANLMKLSTSQPAVFHMATAASNAISENKINATYRGVVSRTSATGFDFVGSSGAGGAIWTVRATIAESGATVSNIQRMIVPSTSSPLIKRVNYHYDYTVAANANFSITANDFDMSTPSGYTVLATHGFTTGNSNVVTRSVSIVQTGTNTVYALRNVSSSQQTGTAYLNMTYIRKEALNG